MKDICKFTIIDEEGKGTECDILFSFKSEETGKSYLVYTDGSLDENGEPNILGSRFTIQNGSLELEDIDNDKELDIIDNYMENHIKEGE